MGWGQMLERGTDVLEVVVVASRALGLGLSNTIRV